MLKGPSQTTRSHNSIELANTVVVREKHGTQSDERDMDRMGKLQELRRQFKFLTVFGFAVLLGNTWEYAMLGIGISLYNGGAAGGIWMLVVVCFGMFHVMLSLAELVSTAPTAGGQYHWISEFSPRKYQKKLSYITGWLCVIAWQTGMAGTAFAVANQLTALIALNKPNYVIQGWHSTLLAIGVTTVAILCNTVLVRKLPLLEGFGLVLHVFGFFAFVVILWVMGPRADTVTTWTKFEDPSGWGNTGLATLVGLLGPKLTLGDPDLAIHFAEEVKDAAWVPSGWDIPVNAVMSTLAVTALLSLINIGSAIAFNIVIALGGLGIIASNIIVISLMLRKRLIGEPLLPSKFDLGKKGGFYVNTIALAYLFIPYVMICFPSIPNLSLIDMNWSSLMFGGLVIFAMVYYYFYGRHKYDGPVEYVKQS
ncbi:hypothetical protein E8E11_003723 [Didymella keratinophila]|nr:hypothetical protein E8E11_003723 [Didymella keratinophila]